MLKINYFSFGIFIFESFLIFILSNILTSKELCQNLYLQTLSLSIYQYKLKSKKMLSAKYFIKDKDLLENCQCSFCFEINFQLLMCQGGACQKFYCKSCMKKFGYHNCHFCQADLIGAYLPIREIQFFCPDSRCKETLRSQRQFDLHCQKCIYISADIKEQFIFKATYSCNNGHELDFSHIKSFCCLCFEYKYTGRCSVCKVRYCVNCRPPPCSKSECPKGHELKTYRNICSITCDFCALSSSILSEKKMLFDRQCNFSVCKTCQIYFQIYMK